MAVDPAVSAPVHNSSGPGPADQVISIKDIKRQVPPPRPGARHSPLPALREPGKVWDEHYESKIAAKRASGSLVDESTMLEGGELWVWDDEDESRELAKKRYEAKEAEACVNDFVADLFSETVPSTPLTVAAAKEERPSARCFCGGCGGTGDVSGLSAEDFVQLNPAEQCGCRSTMAVRRHLREKDALGQDKVDDDVHQRGFLSDFVFTISAPLSTGASHLADVKKRSDGPRRAHRTTLAADAETACNDESASARWDDPHGDSLTLDDRRLTRAGGPHPEDHKYYNKEEKRWQTTEINGKHHLMLNRLRAARGETMHPMLVMDEHGAQTESQMLAREKAEEAERKRATAERHARQAEEQKLAEQTAAAEAEAEAAALRAQEAEAARKAADAAAVAAEATLEASRQRRALEATRSAMVEAEAEEQKLRAQKEQAEVNHSQAEQAVAVARSADERAKSQLGTPSRKRVARTPGVKAHGALSTHLTPQDLNDASTLRPHLEAHVSQMKDWQSEVKGDTETAVQYTENLPHQSHAPKGVADEVKLRMETSFSRHAEMPPPYKPLQEEPMPPPANPRRVVVTVEVPSDAEVGQSLFSDVDGMRILHMEDEQSASPAGATATAQQLPEGVPPVSPIPSGIAIQPFPPSTPPPSDDANGMSVADSSNQSKARSPGGVSYYARPTPPRGAPPAQEELPPPSPTMALNAYQRRCVRSPAPPPPLVVLCGAPQFSCMLIQR